LVSWRENECRRRLLQGTARNFLERVFTIAAIERSTGDGEFLFPDYSSADDYRVIAP
jgi:hypothetical protein